MADLNINTTWFETAALNNTGTFPSFPENMPPSNVNDSAREMMGALKREFDRSHPTATSTGSANALVLTYTIAPTAYVQGDRYSFIIGTTNTGACTVNVNALGAKNIFLNKVALTGSELQAGAVVTLVYDGTQFQIEGRSTVLSPIATNLLINPLMEIDQANEGQAVNVPNGGSAFGCDGWLGSMVNPGASVALQQFFFPPTGLTVALRLIANTGAPINVGDFLLFSQRIEANNFADTQFGTVNAKQLWLQFWVRSTIGSYNAGGALRNFAANRTYPFAFTVNSANTWEQKFISIPGDTAGSWVLSGTAGAASLIIAVACGANNQGTVNTWQAGSFVAPSTMTNSVLTTNGAHMEITGVKLEISPFPTPLLRGQFADELHRCQRYYEKSYDQGVLPGTVTANGQSYVIPSASSAQIPCVFKVTKRVDPSMTAFSPGTGASGKLRDISLGTDIAASVTATGMTMTDIFTNAGNVNDVHAVHWTADARL